MRSWGFLIGPAIGGLLADPVKQYPELFSSRTNGWFKLLLQEFPYLLPNIVVAVVCLISAFLVPFFIHETLESSGQQETNNQHFLINNEQKPLLSDKNHILIIEPASSDEETPIWSRPSTRSHMIFNWFFSFLVTVIDDGFPLFCISSVGGLGFEENDIGQVLSLAGLIFAAGQYISYSVMMARLGLYRTIIIGCAMGLVPTSFIPISIWFYRLDKPRLLVMTFLGVVLGLCKIMACACFSGLAIATNKTVPKTQRAKMNSLLLLGSSVTKGLGPIFAGYLVSLSFSGKIGVAPEVGSVLIFETIGIMGMFVALLAMRLEDSLDKQTSPQESNGPD